MTKISIFKARELYSKGKTIYFWTGNDYQEVTKNTFLYDNTELDYFIDERFDQKES